MNQNTFLAVSMNATETPRSSLSSGSWIVTVFDHWSAVSSWLTGISGVEVRAAEVALVLAPARRALKAYKAYTNNIMVVQIMVQHTDH